MRASAVIPCPNRQKSITGNDPNGVAFKNVPAVPVKPRSGEPTGSRFLCGEHGPTNLLQRLAARCAPQGKWRKSMPTKTREKKSSGGNANALQKPLQPSVELTAVIGSGPLPRGQVVSKIWEYIRSHNLQNPENRREILADDKLRRVFGKDKVTMFEMNKHLAAHLK